MKSRVVAGTCLVLFLAAAVSRTQETGRHPSGRPLPALPPIKEPVMFNTPEADKILAAMQVFPADNAWNEDISQRPLLKNSKAMVATVGDAGKLAANSDMGFIIVPPDQKKVDVKIAKNSGEAYGGESDPGPFPAPDNMPVEDWRPDGKVKLEDVQRSTKNGDRHALVVDPVNGKLYEFYHIVKTDIGWTASQTSIFDLKSNKLRPDGWTSTDAAGLPVFPGTVRYDELERGMVEHAIRFTIKNSRNAYVYPATHYASRKTNPDFPRMGERFRLRQDFDVTGFSPHAQAILKGMKKYGLIVADNGGNWRISVAPDSRIKGLGDLSKVKGADFEVVEPTGPNEGPRRRSGHGKAGGWSGAGPRCCRRDFPGSRSKMLAHDPDNCVTRWRRTCSRHSQRIDCRTERDRRSE